jgi:hypothetical protein
MASYKMLLVAVVLVVAWAGAATVCLTSIATVPANMAAISAQRGPAKAPASSPELQTQSAIIAER